MVHAFGEMDLQVRSAEALLAVQRSPANRHPNPKFQLDQLTTACVALCRQHEGADTLVLRQGLPFVRMGAPTPREPLSWNPLLQCIEWFRTGFFRDYDPPWLDKTYIFAVAFGTVLVGLILERALRRRMRTQ